MAEWVFVAKADEIAPGGSKVVSLGGEEVVVFNVEGRFFATGNRCPHAAGPLEHAWIEDGRVICPWHAWSFQLDPEGAPNDALPRYRTEVRDGGVYFEHPAIAVDKSWK